MIKGYRDRDTERLAAGERVRRWEPFRRQAEKRLRILDAAGSLVELAALNSNHLESLKGNRKGQYSFGLMTSGGFVLIGQRMNLGHRALKLSTTAKRRK